eukprot:scaffold103712_cov46-Tisochrysis_lutea.AAC.1
MVEVLVLVLITFILHPHVPLLETQFWVHGPRSTMANGQWAMAMAMGNGRGSKLDSAPRVRLLVCGVCPLFLTSGCAACSVSSSTLHLSPMPNVDVDAATTTATLLVGPGT